MVLCAINTKSKQNTRKGAEDQHGETRCTNGLYAGHAYSLLQAEKVSLTNGDTINLVCVRNPWGKCEWEREWSDNSQEWNGVSDGEKKRIGFHPDDPEHGVPEDGVFWMTFKAWAEEFQKFAVCMLPLR